MSVEQSYVEINSSTQIEQVRNQLELKMSEWREKRCKMEVAQPNFDLLCVDPVYLKLSKNIGEAGGYRILFDLANMGGVVYLIKSDAEALDYLLTGV